MSLDDRPVTVVVPARNAGGTIARAIRSVDSPLVREIVLVDHACHDDTCRLARAASAVPLRVVQAPDTTRLGGVRALGLGSVCTPFSICLDADDELLPGRIERLTLALERGADVAVDEAEIVPFGGAASPVRARIPPCLLQTRLPVRLFERQYLPAPGPIGARVSALSSIGYDPELHGPEDTDLLLRAVRADLQFALVTEVGYRIYASPSSTSRQRTNQRAMYRRLLMKHAPADVEHLYLAERIAPRIAAWGLVSFHLFREEYAQALALVDALSASCEPDEILECDGPCPRTERWRTAFHHGTLSLLLDRMDEACVSLSEAEALDPTPEGANNLGVALRLAGRESQAVAAFATALERLPTYADAQENLQFAAAGAVTTHPLRVTPCRNDYVAARTSGRVSSEPARAGLG